METGDATRLGLAAAKFLERSYQACSGPDTTVLLGLFIARLQQACVEPFWDSTLRSCHQTTSCPVNAGPTLSKSVSSCQHQTSCLTAVSRFTATPVSCTEASTAGSTSVEWSTTMLLRSAVLLAHISSCILARCTGSCAESTSWSLLMHISGLLRDYSQLRNSKTLTFEHDSLCSLLLETLVPILQ